MQRFLIVFGLTMFLVGIAWPLITRIGLGRLPGDIVIQRDNVTIFIPLGTMLLVSVVASVVLGLINRR